MIKHIVMWKVVGDDEAKRCAAAHLVKQSFEALRGRIPGMLHIEIGIDYCHFEHSCDVVLYSEFESKAALNAYAMHPEHLRVRDLLIGVRITRHQVDYQSE
ncbi:MULTISPECIES: Dabb family protein [unclassified Pseudomonas]|uniref:Dabb family protein n=1 Tax=unclassified Pseudomonas TaxID=196821 RepID=UPI00088DE4F8|nr:MULTISPECIES: Dabb family protein [unclassified Pseudomonas]SCY83805.1 Stress responsive A/B Barrel Domain [Pseudomonas sp. NFACC37-1]SFO81861.1 Stress responsive A/B Barrel Domain [Pseudomonas sp. NFACC24-1]